MILPNKKVPILIKTLTPSELRILTKSINNNTSLSKQIPISLKNVHLLLTIQRYKKKLKYNKKKQIIFKYMGIFFLVFGGLCKIF